MITARQGEAERGMVGQSKARPRPARPRNVRQGKESHFCVRARVRRCTARLGWARRGMAGHRLAGHGEARQGIARLYPGAAWRAVAMPAQARQGGAGSGPVRLCHAWLRIVGQSVALRGAPRQGAAVQGVASRGKARIPLLCCIDSLRRGRAILGMARHGGAGRGKARIRLGIAGLGGAGRGNAGHCSATQGKVTHE